MLIITTLGHGGGTHGRGVKFSSSLCLAKKHQNDLHLQEKKGVGRGETCTKKSMCWFQQSCKQVQQIDLTWLQFGCTHIWILVAEYTKIQAQSVPSLLKSTDYTVSSYTSSQVRSVFYLFAEAAITPPSLQLLSTMALHNFIQSITYIKSRMCFRLSKALPSNFHIQP